MKEEIWKDCKIRVKDGWEWHGRSGRALGEPICIDTQYWIPILFDDQLDPDWFKLSGVDKVVQEITADEEIDLRIYLWKNHGHSGGGYLYGDDGELQCKKCLFWDYKRAPLLDLVKQVISLECRQAKEITADELYNIICELGTWREVADLILSKYRVVER